MFEYLKKVASQTGDFIKGLSVAKKAGGLIAATAVIGGFSMILHWASDKTFAPLMTNLNTEDAANIIRVLREKHIPFKVDPSGKNISIPPENLYEFRLELATIGLPQSSVVGYELFDKQSVGTTSYVQKINQKRALEGELIRTIQAIKGVKRARVHLAIPQKSTFIEDQKKSTASVVVDLDASVTLSEKQIFGIGNLIARAVEGLEIADVVIVNSDGRVLSKNITDPIAQATASQIDMQQKIEDEFEKRIEGILSRVVGEGHVTAKVNAEVDFSQANETQTTYDADGSAVFSVEKRKDNMNMVRPGPGGAPGSSTNSPGQTPPMVSDVKNQTTKDNEVINYQIPQTIRRITKPSGTVKKLSVAVVVDGKQVKTVKDGKTETKVEPWSPEKIKEFEDIVVNTVGLDRKRGDTLDIKNLEFSREDFEETQKLLLDREKRAYIHNLIFYGVIGLIITLFFLYVVRPFIKWLTENTIDSVDSFLPQTIEELERLQKNATLPGLEEAVPVLPDKMDPEKVEGEMIREKVTTLVEGNPHKAAMILKEWLHSEKKDDSNKDKGKTA